MEVLSTQYVPVLKWRQGEYQTLYRLSDSAKDGVYPLINIPPIEYDFEEKRLKKTAHEHVELFPKRFSVKWGNRGAFIDFDESLHDEFMDTGLSVMDYVFDELNNLGHTPVPVTGLSRSKNYQSVIKSIQKKCKSGLAIRVKFEELMHPDVSSHIIDLVGQYELVPSDVDLIIDLCSPQSFEPYETFARALTKRINSIAWLGAFRSFVIAATSINISNVKPPGDVMPRHEWGLYKSIVGGIGEVRCPSYGDYCIEPPGYTELDMRFINAAGKIVYTTDDTWFIRKGKAFRGDEIQMIQHCKDIVNSGFFKGKTYSWGDDVIDKTSKGLECSKSRTIWKQVGFSHHITFVVEQLSILHGP